MDYLLLCKTLSRAISSGVRLYQNGVLVQYTSAFTMEPDPALPYLNEILSCTEPVGIYTTPLFQLYGYFDTDDRRRIVIGPSGMPSDDAKELENLLFLLGISEEKKDSYLKKLHCAPHISLERFVWLLEFLVTAINRSAFSSDNIFMNRKLQTCKRDVTRSSAEKSLQMADDTDAAQIVRGSYAYEKMLLSDIQKGQVEPLQELFAAGITVKAGEMAKSALRQARNEGICGAAIASRAAIAGGLDSNTAFGLSDLYIQKFEMLQDYNSIMRLHYDMFIEFAQRVRLVQYCVLSDSAFFKSCARFITTHLTTGCSTVEIAQALHLSRSYLCTHFKAETGITLSQYIAQEKAEEAKRLLRDTDKNLSEIATYLAFSSQSHFQNAFKKATGQTPMAYRREKQ